MNSSESVTGASGDFSSGPAGLLLQSLESSSPSVSMQVTNAELVLFDRYKKLIPVIQTSRSIMAMATILFAADTVYCFCIVFFMIASNDAKIRYQSSDDKR